MEENKLTEKIAEQDKKLDSISSDVKSIVVALKGDDFGNEGIIKKVKQNESEIAATRQQLSEHINSVEKKDQYKKGQMAIIAVIGGFVATIISWLPKVFAVILSKLAIFTP